MKLHKITAIAIWLPLLSVSYSQCPETTCETHTSTILVSNLPLCENSTVIASGDLDNNSDCESPEGLNCYKFIIINDVSEIERIDFSIGKGGNCNGEIDIFYSLLDDTCSIHQSSGSQNQFSMDFDSTNQIIFWVCDGSSGVVSMCNLCASTQSSSQQLPVELANFTASQTNEYIELTWNSLSEVNNKGFEIQESRNGLDWEYLHFINGMGNSSKQQSYKYIDRMINPFENYYRLKQIDYNGHYEYSDMINVRSILNTIHCQISPNPNNGSFSYQVNNPNRQDMNIQIMTSQGELVEEIFVSHLHASTFWKKQFLLGEKQVYFIATQIGVSRDIQKIVVF